MRMPRPILGLVAALLAMPLLALPPATSASAQDSATRYVIVLADASMPVAGAALHLAISAEKSGREVTIALLAGALDLARKGASGPDFPPYSADGPAMLGQAMAAGATVAICRICLENQNLTLDAMVDGIAQINAPQLLDRLEAADVVLTFGAGSADSGIAVSEVMAPAEPMATPVKPTVDDCNPETDPDECM